MTKKIIASSYLEYCPSCNGKLLISNATDNPSMICEYCDYQEPSDNPETITFISSCIAEYALLNQVDTVFLKGNEFTIRECMEGNGLLPLFVERAEEIQQVSGLSNIPGVGLQIKTVEDIKGLLRTRVVMKETAISVASTLAILVEVLHETMILTNTLNTKYYGNQICLDYMPTLNPAVSVSETSAAKLHSALQVSAKMQPRGAQVDPR